MSAPSLTSLVTGASSVILAGDDACDPSPHLARRKSRKYMGRQDDLAVVATGRALASAGFAERARLGERAGLFFAIGYIPFRREDILPVLEASTTDGRFDPRRFGAGGFQQAHPLLTFRCLPNMPAYHVSANFGVEGPYAVTYPGPAQLYAALEQAIAALADGAVDLALVGAVAAQSNFLVEHHFARVEPPVAAERLRDAAAVFVLERDDHARARGAKALAKLESLAIAYAPIDLLAEGRASIERVDGAERDEALGPALLGVSIAEAIAGGRARMLEHVLESREGVSARSTWGIA